MKYFLTKDDVFKSDSANLHISFLKSRIDCVLFSDLNNSPRSTINHYIEHCRSPEEIKKIEAFYLNPDFKERKLSAETYWSISLLLENPLSSESFAIEYLETYECEGRSDSIRAAIDKISSLGLLFELLFSQRKESVDAVLKNKNIHRLNLTSEDIKIFKDSCDLDKV